MAGRGRRTESDRAKALREVRFDADGAWVLSDPRGRRWVEEWLVAANTDGKFQPGPMLEYGLGRRSLALDMIEQIERVAGPAVRLTMRAERDAAASVEADKASEAAAAVVGDE